MNQPAITQETFKESPYVDATWEIIGHPPTEARFSPMEVGVVRSEQTMKDPMFRDYGGHAATGSKQRWHLPAELAAAQAKEKEQKKVQEVDRSIKILPEELERLKQEAKNAGLEAGRAEVQAKQQQLTATINTKLDALVKEMKNQLEQNVAKIERAAVDLALQISKKLVDHAVEINPEYIVPIVREALNTAGGATVTRVRVSPQDMEFIEIVGAGAELKAADATWRFEKDESIQSGCVVDTSAGEVDFELDKAWARIQDSVVKAIR